MKIVLLNPSVDAGHKVTRALQSRGVALLIPGNATDAWQMLQLHGASIDLAIIHREGLNGAGEPGIQLLEKIKNDPAQADLPVIMTSEKWTESDCAVHQNSSQGVNAYLRCPYSENQLIELIEAVFGCKLGEDAPVAEAPSIPVPAVPEPERQTGFVLEDANSVFSGSGERTDTSIHLEAPEPETTAEAASASVDPVSEPALTLESNQVAQELSIPTVLNISPPPTDVPEITPAAEPSLIAIELGEASLQTKKPEELSGAPEAAATPDSQVEVPDGEIAKDMPYLFGTSSAVSGAGSSALNFVQPLGDAVVPGGAAQAPDLETLKKYLLLREQDVAALSSQLKSAREHVSAVEATLQQEKNKNVELAYVVGEHERKIANFEKEKNRALDALQNEIAEYKFQIKAKVDKARSLEIRVREATEETERLKERVRTDIRKIRVREKELENRLEIMKKDSEALIGARENKIIELKRKLDLLEFNMDLLQDQYSREKENAAQLKERLAKAAQVVRLAGGLLDADRSADDKENQVETEKEQQERAAS